MPVVNDKLYFGVVMKLYIALLGLISCIVSSYVTDFRATFVVS